MAASSVSRVCIASVSLCNPVWLVYQHHKFNKQIPCYRGVHTIFIKVGRYLDLTWSANSKPANSLTIVQNKLRHGILGPLLQKHAEFLSTKWSAWYFKQMKGQVDNPDKIYLFKVSNRNNREVQNMFKVNNKNTRKTSMTSFLCFYC